MEKYLTKLQANGFGGVFDKRHLQISNDEEIRLLSCADLDGVCGFVLAADPAGQQAGQNHTAGEEGKKEARHGFDLTIALLVNFR